MRTRLLRIVRELGRRVNALVNPPLRVPAQDLEALVKEIDAEIARELERMATPRLFVRVEPPPPGLEACDLCGQLAAPRGNRLSLHYPNLASGRPCVRSWPPATTRSAT